MSNNKFYRILAMVGVVFLLAFGILLAVFYGTRNEALAFIASGAGGIGVIIWLYLYIVKKNMERAEQLNTFLENQAKDDPDQTEQPDSTQSNQEDNA